MSRERIAYYHNPCTDGMCSAYLLSKALNNILFVGVKAGTKEMPELKVLENAEVYLLDISFPREVLKKLSNKNKVVVLDHHKSAQEDLKDLPFCIFDMNKCGARLTWEYCWDNFVEFKMKFSNYTKEKPHPIVEYVEDRDLWKNALPHTHEVSASLRSRDLNFKEWDKMFEMKLEDLVNEGISILRYRNQLLNSLRRNYKFAFWKNKFIVFTVAQVGELVSDQLNAILRMERDVDLAVGIQFLLDENKFVCSLRSLNKADCSAIAKEFGGGGHPNAAGFVLDLNYLKDFLSSFVVLDKALEAITQ